MPVSRKTLIKSDKLSKRSKNIKRNKKTCSVVRKMRGGTVKITDTIYLEILDLLNCSPIEYDNFIKLYEPDLENLCVNKKTNVKTQSLFQFINKDNKYRWHKYTLIYLYEESESITKHIIAFALINTNEFENNKIIILELICSHKNPYKIREKTLGIYLLDYLYDYYKIYSTGIILKIEPATQDLITYYTEWKTPNISIDNLNITYGYLIYGNINKILDKTLEYLFNSQINGIKNIMIILSIKDDLPEILDTLDKKKSYLTKIALESNNENIQEQVPEMIRRIKLSSLQEIKDIFILNKENV
jgi:hypothetical protein